MARERETDDVYKALVADLAYGAVPTSIMGVTIAVIGSYVVATTGGVLAVIACASGCLGSLAKIFLTVRHRRFNDRDFKSLSGTRRFERVHFAATACVAISVGVLAAVAFRSTGTVEVLATALLFGYCAGVVCRLSARPVIAGVGVALAAVPGIVVLFANGDLASLIASATFAVFLLGSYETIRHVYRNARRHIEAQTQMAILARRDHLTGLPNRLALEEASKAGRFEIQGQAIAVHAFDLDGFKATNDRYGHAAGDELLRALASRLTGLLSERDFVARIGGDEFVVVQTGISSPNDPVVLATRIHDVLTAPYAIRRKTLTVGLSLGYAMDASENADIASLIEAADAASYRVKHGGGGLQAA